MSILIMSDVRRQNLKYGASPMRRLVFTSLSAILLLATIGSLSPAAAARYRYCLQGANMGYPGSCMFSTFRECRAAASGRSASCGVNPAYASAHQRRSQYRASYGQYYGSQNNQGGWGGGWGGGWNTGTDGNTQYYGNPNNRGGLVGGSDAGTYRP
jgi:hypothetical protein